MRLNLRMSLGILVLSAVVLSAAIAGVGASASAPVGKITNGGTFRLASSGETFRITALARNFGSIDPALSASATSGALLDATCARLFNYPDKPPPEGFRVVPEVAAGFPQHSRDYKKYTFTLRKGFRFSRTGVPVRASAFARAIDRALSPAMQSPGGAAPYLESIVGAKDVLAGRAIHARGVTETADGMRLVIRFTRATPDFTLRTTMSFMCAVPPALPIDPEGEPTFDAAGPYYVAQNVLGRRLVLKRNTYYRGKRTPHVKQFVVDFVANPDDVLDRIERGEADWGWAPPPFYFDPGSEAGTKVRKK